MRSHAPVIHTVRRFSRQNMPEWCANLASNLQIKVSVHRTAGSGSAFEDIMLSTPIHDCCEFFGGQEKEWRNVCIPQLVLSTTPTSVSCFFWQACGTLDVVSVLSTVLQSLRNKTSFDPSFFRAHVLMRTVHEHRLLFSICDVYFSSLNVITFRHEKNFLYFFSYLFPKLELMSDNKRINQSFWIKHM